MNRVSIRVRDGFGLEFYGFFSQYYPELFPLRNITVSYA